MLDQQQSSLTHPKSSSLTDLAARGYLYQVTDLDSLDSLILSHEQQSKSSQIVGYVGFDCTAKSLHVGNLIQIMLMRRFQNHGHKPIILLGGATTQIGDPSDKNELRKMLSQDEIEDNKASIRRILEKFLNFNDNKENSAIIVDNLEWWRDISYLDFLREYGRYFSINRMLGFESIKRRLNANDNLTFLEFNYMLLQAYDFLYLNSRFNCQIQFGGSEQWGNIVSGIDLVRKIRNTQSFGLTTPLITTSDGTKMGKTVQGAVWLSSDMLSPYEYWQFWRNVGDTDVMKFLKLYTDYSQTEINNLVEISSINELKIILANAATTMCHSAEQSATAAETAQSIFHGPGISLNMPTYFIELTELKDFPVYKALTVAQLSSSGSEARKLISAHSVRVNDVITDSETSRITEADFSLYDGQRVCKISCGKKRHALLIIEKK